MSVDLQKVNIGSLWIILAGCVTGVVFAFSYFAAAEDLNAEKVARSTGDAAVIVELAYSQFYARLDDYEESTAEGNADLADEHKRQMERLKAKICAVDKEWERCDG